MKRQIFSIITSTLCISTFTGCSASFNGNSMSNVRKRADKLRHEMSETIISAYKEKNAAPIKALLCPLSQELPDVDEQIQASFSFMEGNIQSYMISEDISGEHYSKDYDTITAYDFYNDIHITADTGRKYRLRFHVDYISDERIKGITQYSITEDDRENGDKNSYVGYEWSSPYDKECGVISAKIIKALADKDANALKSILCPRSASKDSIDEEIQAAFTLFDGSPLFTEREDGLYRNHGSDTEFTSFTLGYESTKDESGNEVGVWANVLAHSIYTDVGTNYTIKFAAYLVNQNSEVTGVSYIRIEDNKSKSEATIGDWIR